jgi:type II secretory pathway pseudopilin PulG
MKTQRGFSYLVVMFLVALLSIVSVRALEHTMTSERRDKETALLIAGQAYRNAIRLYYEGSPGSGKIYPQELKDLLYDARLTRPNRPLRKLYIDPMTGSREWGLVRNEAGRITGVYSLSQAKPFKRDAFVPELGGFAGAQRYSDWKFVYQP